MNTFQPQGVCSRKIEFSVAEDHTLHDVHFVGGCNGNGQGIGALIEGMPIDDAIRRLKGIRCGFKSTSCPDQLAKALLQYKEAHPID
jgi:uncharacterized protein (TIGR03905 family)